MKGTVLVIEHDRAIADVIRVKLALDGWHLVETLSAEEGLRVGQPAHPDLVIADIDLLGNGSEDFLGKWGVDRPPFLVVARNNGGRLLRSLSEQPGVTVMARPFRLCDLGETVQQLVGHQRTRQD